MITINEVQSLHDQFVVFARWLSKKIGGYRDEKDRGYLLRITKELGDGLPSSIYFRNTMMSDVGDNNADFVFEIISDLALFLMIIMGILLSLISRYVNIPLVFWFLKHFV
jgi:hypothetical protein